MSASALILLVLLFLATSVIGVVTGSNSLITVPVMFQFGVEERTAVATNMFGLVFMAVGGSIPFLRAGRVNYRKIWPLAALTVVSSAIGAALVGLITGPGMKLIVSGAMIGVAIFILVRERFGAKDSVPANASAAGHDSVAVASPETPLNRGVALLLVFLLGIYGGLYSGGYVTILTAVLVAFAGMDYGESIAVTKVINVFSSLVATCVFMWQGLVDYQLGLILGVTMFVGAYVGAHFASRMNEAWLRLIFLSTVFLLALKTLYDLAA